MAIDWGTVKHFQASEWPKDPDKVDPGLVHLMDRIRAEAGVPVHIHVAYDDGGHSERSFHYLGQAVDFHFGEGLSPLDEFTILSSFPEIGGIGFYPFWLPRPGWHVDLRASKPRLLWVKRALYVYGAKTMSQVLAVLTADHLGISRAGV